jgi:hypothetical protein
VTDIGGDFLALRGYLAGNLPAEQVRVIEERLARDPKLVRELELHLRMREGFEQVHAQRERAMAAARRRELRTWSSGLAAAAGCAGLALLLWTQQRTPDASLLQESVRSNPALADVAPVTAHFTFVTVRGAARPDLELPASGLIELRAAADSAAGTARYRLTLARQDAQSRAQTVGNLSGVHVAGDGYLHSYVDAANLSPGDYLLRVQSEAKAQGAAATFPFRLRLPGH